MMLLDTVILRFHDRLLAKRNIFFAFRHIFMFYVLYARCMSSLGRCGLLLV